MPPRLLRRVGLALDGAPVALQRPREVAAVLLDVAEVAPGPRVRRLQLERAQVGAPGRVEGVEQGVEVAQREVPERAIRLQRDQPRVAVQRGRGIAALHGEPARGQPCRRGLRVQAQGLPVAALRRFRLRGGFELRATRNPVGGAGHRRAG